MTLELRIAGPGLDLVRVLEAGADALILGRDAECGVCLPDPERNVSRRHLSVWNEGGQLHFHVLSIVNGVETPAGEAAPGARGVLEGGQVLRLAGYSLTVVPAEADDATSPTDPWAELDREASGMAPLDEERTTPGVAPSSASEMPEDDPFGDWGFETTFGPGAPGGGGLRADELGVAPDIGAFYRGLGLDLEKIGPLSQGELESIGRMVRVALLGLLELQAQAFKTQRSVGADERTMVAAKERNPLGGDWPDHTKLKYLFGGRATSGGLAHPERAVREVAGDLLAHQVATGNAVRLAVQSLLDEFEPETLKLQLLGAGGRLFESARAWDAYTRHYQEKSLDAPAWTQRLIDRHFTETYLREFMRVKQDTAARLR